MALSEQENKSGYGYSTNNDEMERGEMEEDDNFRTFAFSEKSVRMGFIRKVYLILTAQLTLTMAVIALFTFEEHTKNWVIQNTWLMWVAVAGTFVCIITLACCGEVRRSYPNNLILLGVFTGFESILLGFVASVSDSKSVMMAAGITLVVAVSLTLFAFQTKWDFTMMGGALFVFLIILVVFGLLCLFIRNYYMELVYASLGALLFSVYLVYDTQLMIGGKHKYTISPEEYIFAALNLYLDIINLFLYILMIIQKVRGE